MQLSTSPTASPAQRAPDAIDAHALGTLLQRVRGVTLLSLDCFDTIVWRYTDAPIDVFFDMARRPSFAALGFTALGRIKAEKDARELQQVRTGRSEVRLADIYRRAFPGLDDEQVRALAEDELAAEMQACHAFGPAVDLLRQARARGLPVMIVSDTYFDGDQLRRLLAHVLPADAMAAIGKVVCSCEHGYAKSQGLFKVLHERSPQRKASMLHVGDNPRADVLPPRRLGMTAVHLVQRDADASHCRQMRAVALGMLDPRVRGDQSMPCAYDGVLSAAQPRPGDPAHAIGYRALGQVMHAFGRWIADEARDLQLAGKRVKHLFLLRDGHLPHQVCERTGGLEHAYRVRISRFTAYASSFRGLSEIDDYLAQFVGSGRYDAMCRQLLLPADLAAQLMSRVDKAGDPQGEFCRLVRRPETVRAIVDASAAFRARFKRYLEREVDLQAGDTLVFVDLGYVGTAQRVLQPVLRDEWGIEVLGRYLLAVRADGQERAGLIDATWCDERTISTLVPYVALMENLCASDEASIVDYADDGSPILGDKLILTAQSDRVTAIQAECLRFVADTQARLATLPCAPSARAMRASALAEFARMVFFPSAEEVVHLEGFELDLNMGTEDRLMLVDRDAGLDGLRRNGMFFMERNVQTMRMAYPAELRSAGLELSMTLLAQHRHGLDIGLGQWSHRHEELPLLLLKGERSTRQVLTAQATHDGYFAATLPLGDGSFHVGVLLGQRHAWVQVHSIDFVPVDHLLGARESQHRQDAREHVLLDGMCDHGQGLLECETEQSLLMIPAGAWRGQGDAACRLVFRPVVRRESPTLN